MTNHSSGSKSAVSTSRITLAVFAAAVCILTLSSVRPLPAAAPTPIAKGDAHAGEQTFQQRCYQCHSIAADEVRVGPSLYHELKKPKPKKTDAEVRLILKNGKNKMPAWGGGPVLSTEDTDNLLAYLHTL